MFITNSSTFSSKIRVTWILYSETAHYNFADLLLQDLIICYIFICTHVCVWEKQKNKFINQIIDLIISLYEIKSYFVYSLFDCFHLYCCKKSLKVLHTVTKWSKNEIFRLLLQLLKTIKNYLDLWFRTNRLTIVLLTK